MSQNKRKKARKSRLVPRDCLLNEEFSLIQSLQENPSNMAVIDDDCVMVESPRQFSVKVEVEPCSDTYLDAEQSNDSNSLVMPIKNTISKPKDLGIKRYVIDPDEIIKEMETISQITTNLADQLLSIELRNSLGRGVLNRVDETSQEKIIQNAVWKWRSWKQNDSGFREPPLCYKCYICKKGWWYLTAFREHLSQHDERNLKVELEVSFHECSFAACLDYLPEYKDIPIEGKCWKCNKTFVEHLSCKSSKYFYVCKLCNSRHYTCVLLRIHEGMCEMYRRALSNSEIQVSYKLDEDTDLGLTIKTPKNLRCHICNLICFSNYQLSEHMTSRHMVRSDLPEACLPPKHCSACGDKVVNQNLHPCKIKSDHASCNYCCRKFQNKMIASLHMKMSQDDVQCRVCSNYLPKQCMEMEHLVEHSDNYRLVYKCLLCPNISYCLSESSIRQHRVILHKKHDVKRSFYELIFIPKGCIESSTCEYVGVKLQDSEKKKTRAMNSVLEKNKIKNNLNIMEVKDEKDFFDINSAREINEISSYDKVDVKSNVNNNKTENAAVVTACKENNTAESDSNDKSFVDEHKNNCETNITNNAKIVNGEIEYDSEENCFRIEIDDIKKELNEDEENSKLFEIENEILKVFQASKRFNITPETDNLSITEEIQVKSEPIDEEDYEDDIIVLRMDDSNNETDFKVINPDSVALNVASKALGIKQQNFQINIKENTNIIEETDNIYDESLDIIGDESLDVVSDDAMLIPLEPKIIINSYKKRKLYKCSKCEFKGYHREYREHIYQFKHAKKMVTYYRIISYKCTKCNITFDTLAKYAMHFKEHNFEENGCPQCLAILENTTKCVSHINSHIKHMITKVRSIESGKSNAMEVYRCRKCNLRVEENNIFSHWESHLNINDATLNKYMRPDIQKSETQMQPSFNNELQQQVTDLLQMTNRDRSQNKYDRKCIVCKHNFDRTSDWKRHLIEHLLANAYAEYTQNGGLACQICNEVFRRSEQYKYHMRDHGSLPVYKCELCNKSFGDSSNFSKHKKVHNMAVVVCDICKKKFHSKHTLEIHMLMHLTTDPIQCSMCPKIFYTNSTYKKHVNFVHEGYKQVITCKLCSTTFRSFKEKWDHMWEVHKIRKYKADCPICNLSFRKFFDLRKHCREMHNIALKRLNNTNGKNKINSTYILEEEHCVLDV